MQMMKTIVIGAGVMGASVAYRLAQAGAAVTVLEAMRIGGGTSGISFACRRVRRHSMVARRRQSGMGSRTRSRGAA
jgi:glycine/D-amino acid oxidase-like deaminating enzyme